MQQFVISEFILNCWICIIFVLYLYICYIDLFRKIFFIHNAFASSAVDFVGFDESSTLWSDMDDPVDTWLLS